MNNLNDEQPMNKNRLKLNRSISSKILVYLTLAVTLITIVSCIFAYRYSKYSTMELVKEQLLQYVGERSLRESSIFMDLQRLTAEFKADFINQYSSASTADIYRWFERDMQFRQSDSTYRLKPDFYYGRELELGRIERYLSAVLVPDEAVREESLRAMAIGFDLVKHYGPMLREPFSNIYFCGIEQSSVDYWPETPWSLIVDVSEDWRGEEWYRVSTPQSNPDRRQIWTGLYYDEWDENWMVSCITPIDIVDNPVGLIGADLLLDDLLERSLNLRYPNTYNLIFQGDGRLISHYLKTDELIENEGLYYIQNSDDEQLKAVFDGVEKQEQFPALLDIDEIDAVVAVDLIEGPDWYFCMIYPKSMLFQDSFRTVLFVFILGFFIWFAMSIILWLLLKKNLIHPIVELTKSISKIVYSGDNNGPAGNLLQAYFKRDDELGILSRSIVKMNQHIESHIDELNSEIKARADAEKMIAASLEENRVLLKEVHHRVKNNLAIIVGLLNIQSDTIDTVEQARTALEESQNRVISMSLIHEQLYHSQSLSKINVRSYVEQLISSISRVSCITTDIEYIFEIDDSYLEISDAVPFGIILNEILTNIYKHAFDSESGTVDIKFRKNEKRLLLEVRDNGKGLPDDFNIDTCAGIGVTLINSLSIQLQASFEIESEAERGTVVRIMTKDD